MRLPKRRRDAILLLAAIVAAIAVYLLVRDLLGDLDVEKLLRDVSRTLGNWTYLLVGAFAFLETGAFVGLVVPGETVVILGGAVAGQGETDVLLTLWIVWFAAFAGDAVSYLIGRRLGRGFVLRHGPRFRITRERFASVERYFERHGGKTILIGRFVGFVRALAPFVAGSSGMRYRALCPYSILGTGIWAATFTLLGFFASQSINSIVDAAEQGTFLFGTAIVAIVAAIVAFRYLREPENRVRAVDEMERRPVLRNLVALGRRVRPQARFLLQRLTPGGLGLEFTALIAALAVALYVLVAYAIVLSGNPGPTPGDGTGLDVAADLEVGWLTAIAKSITTLGGGYVVFPVAAIAAIGLAMRRHWSEVVVLAGAMAIIAAVVPELKDAITRPRPPDGLVEVSADAYPSGHAAYSVLYPWLALTATVRLRPGLRGGTALIAGGIAVAVLVGLSRAYLRVHFLSDVSGGWALGVSAFALLAAAALVVTHFRQNSRRDGAGGGDRS